MIEQGEIWWLEEPDDKPRPCLVLTRSRAIPVLSSVLIAPVTRRVRGIDTEVLLDARDGVPSPCAAAFDSVRTVRRGYLTRPAGRLAPGRWYEVCHAMRIAIGC